MEKEKGTLDESAMDSRPSVSDVKPKIIKKTTGGNISDVKRVVRPSTAGKIDTIRPNATRIARPIPRPVVRPSSQIPTNQAQLNRAPSNQITVETTKKVITGQTADGDTIVGVEEKIVETEVNDFSNVDIGINARTSTKAGSRTDTNPAMEAPSVSPINKIATGTDNDQIANLATRHTSNKAPSVSPITPVKNVKTKNRTAKNRSNDNSKNKAKIWLSVLIVVLVIAIIVALVVKLMPKKEGLAEIIEDTTLISEGEAENTADILDNYAEVKMEGFNEAYNSENPLGAVGVSVKNISEETVSMMFVLAALDKDNNIVDKHYIYAENIKPGEIQNFEAFVHTPLTPDELRTATYKIYKAEKYIPEGQAEAANKGEVTEGGESNESVETNEATETVGE